MGIKQIHHVQPFLNDMGMRRRVPSWIRFVEGENENPPRQEDNGFPAATPVNEMTPEQQAAYWRHEAKKQQKRAEKFEGIGDPDKIRADIAAAEKAAEDARLAAMSESEKALEAARKEAREAGIAEGSGKWLKDAVQSHVALLSQAPGETPEETKARVNGVLQYIDPTQFVGSDGALDAEKLTSFANSLGSGVPAPKNEGDPLIGLLQRQNQPPQGAGGSVSALEQQAYERMTGAK